MDSADPIVLAHAQALLRSSAPLVDYINADARDTPKILDAAARTLDFGFYEAQDHADRDPALHSRRGQPA